MIPSKIITNSKSKSKRLSVQSPKKSLGKQTIKTIIQPITSKNLKDYSMFICSDIPYSTQINY